MATLTGLFTIGRDAETRVTQGGTTVVQLAVAYNYGRKGDDGKFQSTPVITDGRTHSFNPFSKERGVSIHARHH